MSHKTMIDGVAYEISGGKTLIDGTAFSIKNGKTLVDGTAYEVGFAPSEVTVTVTSPNEDGNYAYLELGGSEYFYNEQLVLPAGTVIRCWASNGAIYLNGTPVVDGATNGWKYYDYSVTKNCTIRLEDTNRPGYIYITEE